MHLVSQQAVKCMCEIRKYRPEDRERLRYICRETAWDSYKKDPKKLETVPILYNDYFTEQEPDHIFVAVNENDQAVGYVICSSDAKKFHHLMKTEYRRRALRMKKSVFFHWLINLLAFDCTPKQYRVHLHIDILPAYQHMGLGTRLLDALSAHLYKNGIEDLSILAVDKRSVGYPFYLHYGFREIRPVVPGVVLLSIQTKKGGTTI